MKRLLPTCLLLGALTTLQKNAHAQNWQLVWQDEFTNGISSDWVFETGNGSGGWGNNELQYYRAENASVENGQAQVANHRNRCIVDLERAVIDRDERLRVRRCRRVGAEGRKAELIDGRVGLADLGKDLTGRRRAKRAFASAEGG